MVSSALSAWQLEVAMKLSEELRDKENAIFTTVAKYYKIAIDQCEKAIKTFAEVCADQTLGSGQEYEQYMAGMSLTELKARMHSALFAASALAPKEDKRKSMKAQCADSGVEYVERMKARQKETEAFIAQLPQRTSTELTRRLR